MDDDKVGKMKMKGYFVLLVVLFTGGCLYGQDYEAWLKRERAEREKFAKEEKAGLQKLQKEYDAFVEARDKEFSEFLKQRWKEYEMFAGKKRDAGVPKPKVSPVASAKQDVKTVLLRVENPDEGRLVVRDASPVLRTKKSGSKQVRELQVCYVFYGNKVVLPVDEALKLECEKVNEEYFASYWLRASQSNYDELLDCLFAYKSALGLNDWGYYMLVRAFADHFLKGDNSRHLLCWFLMNKSGYMASLGFGEGKVSILLPARQAIYGRSYISRGGLHYYIMADLKRLATYEKNFAGSNRLLDLGFETALNFSVDRVQARSVVFDGREVKLLYNAHVVDFYGDYPSTELSVYFNTPFSNVAKESLSESLYAGLQGCDSKTRVSKLLSFLHESFPYMTDEEQFGQEKYFFPEEVLFYPYSDCEDRAAFFSSLVTLVAGLPCVGLSYPGHVAAAVKMDSVNVGNYLLLDGERYLSCDPTYIGASIGMSMPRYANQSAVVIKQEEGCGISREREDRVLARVKEAGGNVLNVSTGLVKGKHGEVYVTGVFDDVFRAGREVLKNTSKGNRVFLAKLDKSDRFAWALALDGSGENDLPRHLARHDEDVVLSGSFQGTARVGGRVLQAEEGQGMFVVNVGRSGNVKWTSTVAVPRELVDEGYSYMMKFNDRGEVLDSQFRPMMPEARGEEISVVRDNKWMISGMYTPVRPLVQENRIEAKHERGVLEMADRLKAINDVLVQENVHSTIAGLLAVVSLMSDGSEIIRGEEFIRALDRYNSSFKSKCPNIYKNIKRVDFVKGEHGFVDIKTTDGKSITIDKMRLNNGSRIRFSELPEGHVLVEVVDGMSVGKAFIWFKLNSVKLHRDTGDLVFDYDRDHTLKTFNLGRDILQ